MNSIRERLKLHGLRARKSLGQNFLIDPDVTRAIVDAVGLSQESLVIEIGPGAGALTKTLAERAHRVIAIELDDQLMPLLSAELNGARNVELIHANALTLPFEPLIAPWLNPRRPIHVVSNLPYYITSALIRKILESKIELTSMVLMMQREVAERVVAEPGEMSILAVSVQLYGQPRFLFHVPAAAFYPIPKVDSSVIEIIPDPQHSNEVESGFFDVVKAGFSQPRKQIRNTLSAGLSLAKPEVDAWLAACGVEGTRRAETLSVPEWVGLARRYGATNRSDSRSLNSANNGAEEAPSTENSTSP